MARTATIRASARRYSRLIALGALAAAVGLALQPLHSTMIRIALVSSLLLAGVGALVICRRWWQRALCSLPVLLLVGALTLPGRAPRPVALRAAYADALRGFEGTRYVWGGENQLGIDCSGLVRRGLMTAAVDRGVWELDPALLRLAWDLWWHDASARALRDGYRNLTRTIAAARNLNALDHSKLHPGDLAVTADGVHVLAYLGERTWIEADPELGRVVWLMAPAKSVWFKVPMRLVRWRALD
jgi:NlpC/P60 family